VAFNASTLVSAPGSGRIETHDSVRVEFESTMAVPTARIRRRCRTHRATRVQIPKGTWTGLAEALAGIGRAHRGGAAGSRCHPDRQHAPPRAAHVDDPARGRSASPRSTLALIGAALVFATSCNFNESRWVLRAWAPPARCSLAVRITSRISRPACPAYRRLHEVVILLSSGRV
jgi:hypothetical protein